jgi:VWFA-related protein
VLSLGSLSPAAAAAAAQAKDPLAAESGLVERAGVSLMLIDVVATDPEGKPLRGATEADFVVTLDGRKWPIYSVDDLCACPADEAAAAVAGAAKAAEPSERGAEIPTPVAPAAAAEKRRFVLFFDFSHLLTPSRFRAFDEAGRWIEEVMLPTDEVMVAGYTSERGLRTLSTFTSDKQALRAVLARSREDPTLIDLFAITQPDRVEQCCNCCENDCGVECPACCDACEPLCVFSGARPEEAHGRHSLEAFRRFLWSLERFPGRKELLLFQESGTLFPSRVYGDLGEGRVDDHIRLLDEVGAEAVLSRTSVHTAYMGPEPALANNLGANLADFTGGSYNRGSADLSRLMSEAGRACACVYRIALEPPKGGDGAHVYRVKVDVRGGTVPARYRLTHLDQGERWMRDAQAMLSDPTASTDIPLAASLVPVAGRANGWELSVQLALNAASLALPLRGTARTADWEVGALLTDTQRAKSWEMLAISQLVQERRRGELAVVLHERLFERLSPGRYELRAFVRDRLSNRWGGARAEIELPRAHRSALAGPVVMLGGRQRVRTTLPLRTAEGATEQSRDHEGGTGELPLAARAVRAGEPLEFSSWVCFDEKDKDAIDGVVRYVAQGGEPIFRFEPAGFRRAGECAVFVDKLDTAAMAVGRYTYHVRWTAGEPAVPLAVEASFEIAPPESFAPPAQARGPG